MRTESIKGVTDNARPRVAVKDNARLKAQGYDRSFGVQALESVIHSLMDLHKEQEVVVLCPEAMGFAHITEMSIYTLHGDQPGTSVSVLRRGASQAEGSVILAAENYLLAWEAMGRCAGNKTSVDECRNQLRASIMELGLRLMHGDGLHGSAF